MAKKRTRKQKQQALYHYTLPTPVAVTSTTPSQSTTTSTFTVEDLYNYDTRLIIHDLKKTVAISLAILALQLGIYYLIS